MYVYEKCFETSNNSINMATARKNSPRSEARGGNKDSKIVTFYQNGDRYFKGQVMVITSRRFRSLDVLLSELSRITNLPQGVRYLLAVDDGTNVQSIDELKDGKAYVCSSYSKLKKLSYGNKPALPSWSSKSKMVLPQIGEGNPGGNHSLSAPKPQGYLKQRADAESRDRSQGRVRRSEESRVNLKPKIVTCIRNGFKPRAIAKILLNKRTAQNLDQVLNQVSDSLGASGSTSNIRKLYTTKGQRVHAISELFQEGNDIFIAVGNEKFKPSDIEDIIMDLGAAPKVSNNKSKGRNPGMHREHKHQLTKENRFSHLSPENGDRDKKKSVDNSKEDGSQFTRLPKISSNESANAKIHENKRGNVKAKQIGRGHRDNNEKKQKHSGSDSVTLPQISNTSLVARPPERTQENDNSHEKGVRQKVATVEHTNAAATNNKINTDEFNHGENERNKINKRMSHEKMRQRKTSKDNTRSSIGSVTEYSTIADRRPEEVYDIGRKLGDGNFAIVRECSEKVTKRQYALKIIDKRKIKGKEAMLQDEIRIMRHCRHPNVVRLYEDYDTAAEIYLVMELVKGGDLFDAISSSLKFTEDVASSYVRDVAKALQYLHRQHIVHRDLKPENLLLHKRSNGQTVLKLADFGLAMEVKSPIFTVCGTPTYVAPEILEESGYGLKVDMWAAGVITYIMLCGFPPFRSAKRDQDELFDLIQEGQFEFLSPYWDPVSDEAKELISQLLMVDVKKRYTAEQVLGHPWLRLRSATVSDISKGLLGDNERPTLHKRRRFKAAALAVQGIKKMENLAEQFQHQRGEKVIIT